MKENWKYNMIHPEPNYKYFVMIIILTYIEKLNLTMITYCV